MPLGSYKQFIYSTLTLRLPASSLNSSRNHLLLQAKARLNRCWTVRSINTHLSRHLITIIQTEPFRHTPYGDNRTEDQPGPISAALNSLLIFSSSFVLPSFGIST